MTRSLPARKAGQTIVLQEVYGGKLWSARPMLVVDDARDSLLLWCPAGTMWKTATTPSTRERENTRAERIVQNLRHRDWVLGDFVWPVSNLIMVRLGEWHAVWVGWDDTGRCIGWYVNYQRPYVRRQSGVQTMDLMLDMVVEPDRSWRWKDEDEFATLRDAGLITDEEERHMRREMPAIIEAIESGDGPFRPHWRAWRPNPSWPAPTLPRGWDEV